MLAKNLLGKIQLSFEFLSLTRKSLPRVLFIQKSHWRPQKLQKGFFSFRL